MVKQHKLFDQVPPARGRRMACSEKPRAPRLKREIRLNYVSCSNRISQGARSMTVGPEQGAEHFLGVIRTAVVVEASSSFRVPSGTSRRAGWRLARAPSGRGLWEVRKGRRQRGYYKVSSSFPRRADEECWGTPAPGFRDSGGRGSRAGGTLWLVGVGGCNWMSSIITTDGFYLYFDPGVIARNGSSHRAYGFPLRCLQEHPEGVLLGFSPPNLEPGLRAKKRADACGRTTPIA